jgi:hypothetical protein
MSANAMHGTKDIPMSAAPASPRHHAWAPLVWDEYGKVLLAVLADHCAIATVQGEARSSATGLASPRRSFSLPYLCCSRCPSRLPSIPKSSGNPPC